MSTLRSFVELTQFLNAYKKKIHSKLIIQCDALYLSTK